MANTDDNTGGVKPTPPPPPAPAPKPPVPGTVQPAPSQYQPPSNYTPPPSPNWNGPSDMVYVPKLGREVHLSTLDTIYNTYGPRPRSYWENPQRVARYYLAGKTMPNGMMPNVDMQGLEVAYNYLKARNNNKPFYLWQTDTIPEDEYRQFVDGLSMPPPEAMPPEERVQWYPQPQPGAPEQMHTGEYQPADVPMTNDNPMGMPQAQWDALPDWQKTIIPMLPGISKGLAGAGGAVAGFGMAGPVGAAAGLAGGLGMATVAEQNSTVADWMMKLDIPAEWFERSMGVLSQVGSSLTNPDDYGPVMEVLNNLPAAWEAGHLNYDVTFSNLSGKGTQGWNGVWQAPQGQVASEWALANARKEIKAVLDAGGSAADVEAIQAKYGEMFGLGGQLRDMAGHMFLDPLNLAGPAVNKVGGVAAKAAGNVPLAKAFSMVDEPLKAGQLYGQMLRQMPVEEAARFGAMSKWLAGLDEAGNLKDFVTEGKKRGGLLGGLDYMRGLTPAARAAESLNYTIDGISTFLNDYGADPETAIKMLKAVSGATPRATVDALDGSPLPRWFDSAEAQHIPLAMREAMPKADEMLKQWQVTRGNANILQRVSDLMGQDVNKVMADLHSATPAEAQAIYRTFIDKLGELSKTDQNAAKMLQSIQADTTLGKLDGMQLKKFADGFLDDDGAPFHPSEFNARLMVALAESADNWAAKYFDVKPEHWAVRTGNVVKRAQSLALLGLNPSYFVNNALNNIVTMSTDGLLSLNTHANRAGWLKDLGVHPSRLRSGSGAADMGGVDYGIEGKSIRAAGKANDFIQSVDKLLSENNVAKKLGIFTGLSTRFEDASSEIAMVTAMREFWNKTWRAGAGFDKMPPQLRQVLDDYQAGLSQKIENAVARGKNQAQIQEEVFGKLTRKSLHDVLTPAERSSFDSRFPGVFDDLEVEVGKAATGEEVHAAFSKARAKVQENITKQIQDGTARLATEAMHKAQVEGHPGVLDMMDDIVQSRTDQHLSHLQKMDAVAAQAEQFSGGPRRAIWDQALREADADWKNFQNVEASKWLGVYEGMGADNPAREFAAARLWDMRDNWDAFYVSRRQLMQEFFEFSDASDDKMAKAAKWAEIKAKETDQYLSAVMEEDRLQGALNQHFSDTFGKQSGMTADATKWRKAIQDNRRKQVAAMLAYRDGKLPERIRSAWGREVLDGPTAQKIHDLNHGLPDWQLPLAEREAAAKKFYTEVYSPIIRDGIDVSHANAPVKGGNKPKPQPAAVAQQGTKRTERRLSPQEERLQWLATHDQLTRLKNRLSLMGDEKEGIPGEWQTYKAANPDAKIAVADLRGLHMTNDDPNIGYAAGDQYVISIAQAFKDEGLDAYRYGGDEFAMIFDDTDTADTAMKRVVNRLENAIIVVRDANGNERRFTGAKAHFGVADDPTTAHDLGQRARDADNAARRAAGLPEYDRAYRLQPEPGSKNGAAAEGVGNRPEGAAGAVPERTPAREPTAAQRAAADEFKRNAGTTAGTGGTGTGSLPDGLEPADAASVAAFLAENDSVIIKPDEGKILTADDLNASVERTRTAVRRKAHEVDPTVTADKHIVNIVNKYTDEHVYSIDDVTPSLLEKALENRAKEKSGMTDAERNAETVKTLAQQARESKIEATRHRMITSPIKTMPTQVRASMESTARIMLDELSSQQGTVVNLETNQRMTDLTPWYKALYESTPKNQRSSLHKRAENALGKIVAGIEDRNDELVQWIKQDIVEQLSGNVDPDAADPAVLWFMGNKDAAADIVDKRMGSYSEEQFLQVFGDQKTVDAVVDYAINRGDNAPEPGLVEPEAPRATSPEQPATPVQEPVAAPEPKPEPAPVGTLDSLSEPPLEMANLEGWLKELSPLLDRAESGLTGQSSQKYDLAGLDPESAKALKGYLGKVYSQLADTKMGALRWGETRRDGALLNYTRRYGFDNVLGTVMPYEFWTTRSMMKWGLRALNKPSILANYARLRSMGNQYIDREGFPTRLKKKMGFNMPFLPDWMGDYVYADPLKQIFPFENFINPWEKLKDQRNMEEKHAEGLLQQMVADESATDQEAAQALQTHSGPVWDRALAQARNEIDGDVQNPLDFAAMMSGFSLPVQWASKALQGRQDEIGQLPVTRGVQAVTGALGIGGPRGLNIEAPARRLLGLPEVDRYEDYRVDRMLAGLAAEGQISAEDAQRAMIDRKGEAFTLAQQRVSQMGMAQYIGAPLGIDFFPEGEKQQRALKNEYDNAIGAWKAGDDKALTAFFDKYPEYQARMASFQEPAERMKRFTISEVWQAYNALPTLYKKQAREQLGDTFNDAFLNKETRSYDSIDQKTLTQWAQMMNTTNPTAQEPGTMPLKFADPGIAAKVEQYNATIKQRFPQVQQINSMLYAMPETQQDSFRRDNPVLKEYSTFRNSFLAANPDARPFLLSQMDEMSSVGPDVQQAVYTFRAQRDTQFPELDNQQDEYFALDKSGRRSYLAQHPELKQYWDWRTQYAAQNPKAAAYILGDAKVSEAIDPDYQAKQAIFQQTSSQLTRQMMGYLYSNQGLTSGAKDELKRLWVDNGRPGGDFNKWLDTLKE